MRELLRDLIVPAFKEAPIPLLIFAVIVTALVIIGALSRAGV